MATKLKSLRVRGQPGGCHGEVFAPAQRPG